MRIIDSRRLTGPNVIWERPGAVLDVRCDDPLVDALTARWSSWAARMLAAVGWEHEETCARPVQGGVSLALSARVDALYAATEVAEWAFEAAAAELRQSAPPDLDAGAQALRDAIAEEHNEALIALKIAAQDAGVAFLSDDDQASVGLGAGSKAWPVGALPAPGAIAWEQVHDVPVGLVTGTNGKTTTVRLAAAMARAAGAGVGMTSTEWLSVDGEVIDRGDYAGPGGARTVLRDPRVRLAILEAARGGLLRRGLGPRHADAVAITTIAEDHLGDFGSATLDELTDIKWTLTRALRPGGRLVLNADDPILVARAAGDDALAPVVWCSLDPSNPVLGQHLEAGGEGFTVVDAHLARITATEVQPLAAVDAVPLTLGGAARHNVTNALMASGLCFALGITREAIAQGLRAMSPSDNPGRGNLYTLDEVTVLVDFAHNPQAVEAVAQLARALPAQRRALSFGQAGDRTDAQLRELARVGWGIGLDRLFIAQLADYRRGRELGEVPAMLQAELLDRGARPDQVSVHGGELQALDAALRWARPGDLIVQLALADNTAVLRELEGRGARLT